MKHFIYILLLSTLLVAACQTSKTESSIITMDSLDLAMVDTAFLSNHGIKVKRLSATHAMVIQKRGKGHGVKIKLKNVGNTDNSQTKSNNSDIAIKDKSVEKVKAKEGAAIGEGNDVKQEKGIPPGLLLAGGVLVLLIMLVPLAKKFLV